MDRDWVAYTKQLLRSEMMRKGVTYKGLVDKLAAAAVSPRTLERLFASALRQSAGRYYRNLRLAHARSLATETRLGLNDIAARTGFSSAATLARAYRSRFGQTVGGSRPPR